MKKYLIPLIFLALSNAYGTEKDKSEEVGEGSKPSFVKNVEGTVEKTVEDSLSSSGAMPYFVGNVDDRSLRMRSFVCSSTKCHLPVTPQHGRIIVHGAHANNLKGICFEVPKARLIALTGLSGSGKSSIAVDVLANECVRQLLGGYGLITDHIPKPRVGTILGLSPAITISQRKTDFNSRSLVGTKTGILTLLRNLFATIGHQPCSGCGVEVKQPLQGKHKLVTVETEEKSTNSSSTKTRKTSYFGCPHCGEQLEMLQMSHFSSNAASGICEPCKGMGEVLDVDMPTLLDGEKTILNGGVRYWETGVANHYAGVIEAASKYYKFSFDRNLPIKCYSEELRDFLLYGITHSDFVKRHKGVKAPKKVSEGKFEGVVPHLMAQYKKNPSKAPSSVTKFMVRNACPSCNNTRLGKLGREVTVGGKTIVEVAGLSLSELLKCLETLEKTLPKDELQAYTAFSIGLQERASNLIEVGLHYLTLDRTLPSLSAGEAQRLRLADALGSSALTGVLYILDEPTTGLHPHDTAKLLKTVRRIQENDNTVMVIEHDLDVIESADYIIDVGPGRGTQGGEIVVSGTPNEVMACEKSVTGRHLARKTAIKLDTPTRGDGKAITIRGASENNLKGVDVSIPTQQLVVLTGVSGSGKSTFLFGILDKVMRNHLNRAKEVPGKHASVEGLDNVNRVVTVNQSTIGNSKSSRSNVATYTKLFDLIRGLFASLPKSVKSGFDANAFSFNASDERCENCNGAGVVQVDMSFMPGVEMDCPSCGGMRFSDDLLAVKFAGCNIAEILDLTVSDAIPVFSRQKKILEVLKLMQRVGLEHLKLGQSTSTLSGGEAQRIKLASELSKASRQKTLFLLDEPTTGLHCEEVGLLLTILRELVFKGHTVVVIEHNLDVMCRADTIIDFGPGGGTAGGTIVATGTPQEVSEDEASITGQCLQAHLAGKSLLTVVSDAASSSRPSRSVSSPSLYSAKFFSSESEGGSNSPAASQQHLPNESILDRTETFNFADTLISSDKVSNKPLTQHLKSKLKKLRSKNRNSEPQTSNHPEEKEAYEFGRSPFLKDQISLRGKPKIALEQERKELKQERNTSSQLLDSSNDRGSKNRRRGDETNNPTPQTSKRKMRRIQPSSEEQEAEMPPEKEASSEHASSTSNDVREDGSLAEGEQPSKKKGSSSADNYKKRKRHSRYEKKEV